VLDPSPLGSGTHARHYDTAVALMHADVITLNERTNLGDMAIPPGDARNCS